MNAKISDPKEAQAFLDAHPEIQFVEIIYTGMSGVPRGKRLRRHELMPLYENGRFLPTSMLVTDITGQDCEGTGFIWEEGDADRIGWPVAGRLTPAPWLGPDVAQVPVTVHELDGSPMDLDPRHALKRVIERFAADGLTPVVACELEFFLVDAKRPRGEPMKLATWPLAGASPTQHDQYSLREMQEAAPFLRELWAAADACGIPLEGAISEYAPGQLELTLKHHADALRSGDDAVLYKRAAKGVALNHGYEATFMAKPFIQHAGSGMHMHVSVNDAKGKNIFASEAAEGAPTLRHAVGGMKALLGDSMAIFAPNANSYRRFRANSYAPVAPTWGVNNRTVAFRVPAGSASGRHIEHRVAGADAHPYLALAALLAAVHHGLTNKLDPGAAVSGDGYAHAEETGERLPTNWFSAVERFEASDLLKDYLGARFVRMFAAVKRTEQERFFNVITEADYDWYLRST
ncbi:MAG TPA: glutamine synthetase family protein [Caulobacterales bacterium]|nr:glutamine synthetase family protein [Caulobacterales bacterium]